MTSSTAQSRELGLSSIREKWLVRSDERRERTGPAGVAIYGGDDPHASGPRGRHTAPSDASDCACIPLRDLPAAARSSGFCRGIPRHGGQHHIACPYDGQSLINGE